MPGSEKAPTGAGASKTDNNSIIAQSSPQKIPPTADELEAEMNASIAELEATVPVKKKKLVHADTLSDRPAPIKWLIRKWIQSEALIMLHGDPGSGKSFLAFDWCLSIATNKRRWQGHKVINGPVVYLAGEGLAGVSGRIAAWKNHNEIRQTDLHVYDSPFQIDGDQAAFDEFKAELKELPLPPVLIVVDTVNRFMSGEENSARDTSVFIHKCQELISEFKCSVLLVHHTGHGETSKDRARGSSAWRAAMDIDISLKVRKVTSEKTIFAIVQVKSKDSSPAKPKLLESIQVDIPGWYEETEEGDQEQITSRIICQSDEELSDFANDRLTPAEQAAMESYKRAAEAEGLLSHEGDLAVFLGVQLETWREYFYETSTAETKEAKKKAFQRVRDALTYKKGRLTVSDDIYSLCHDEDRQFKRITGQILIEKRDRDTAGHTGTFSDQRGETL